MSFIRGKPYSLLCSEEWNGNYNAYVAVHDSNSTAGSIRLAELTVCVGKRESCKPLLYTAKLYCCSDCVSLLFSIAQPMLGLNSSLSSSSLTNQTLAPAPLTNQMLAPAPLTNQMLPPASLTNQMVPSVPLTNQMLHPTNQIITSTPTRLATSLHSSLPPATGVSPLRPVSPVLSLTPVSPGLGAPAVGPSPQLAATAQVQHTLCLFICSHNSMT